MSNKTGILAFALLASSLATQAAVITDTYKIPILVAMIILAVMLSVA